MVDLNADLNDIVHKIEEIENHLLMLADRVQNDSVMVTGAWKVPKIIPTNISELEIIKVYNDVPKVLFKNSIVTELTEESYREDNRDQSIILEFDQYGKYWLIVSDENNVFVLPAMDIKLHIYKLKSIAKLFDFQGTPSMENHCLLIKPAKVQSLPSGREWKLEQKGILEFTSNVHQDSLRNFFYTLQDSQANTDLEILKINKQLNQIELQLQQFPQESQNIGWQVNISETIKDNQANTNLEILKINKQLNQIELQLQEFSQRFQDLQYKLTKMSVDIKDYFDLQVDLLKVRLESLENTK